jgi:hypothetical protein
MARTWVHEPSAVKLSRVNEVWLHTLDMYDQDALIKDGAVMGQYASWLAFKCRKEALTGTDHGHLVKMIFLTTRMIALQAGEVSVYHDRLPEGSQIVYGRNARASRPYVIPSLPIRYCTRSGLKLYVMKDWICYHKYLVFFWST